MFGFLDNFKIYYFSNVVNSSFSNSFIGLMWLASITVLKTGKPCFTFSEYSNLLVKTPVISTSSPGLAASILSPIQITSLCLGTLPGGTVPGVS